MTPNPKPKPRPLYRSITFWSGIFVMIFLGFAWWDSMTFCSMASSSRLAASTQWGYFGIGHNASGFSNIGRVPLTSSMDGEVLPLPFFYRGQGNPGYTTTMPTGTYRQVISQFMVHERRDLWGILVPFWIIIAGVALPWLGALAWRARRHRRAEEAALTDT